MSKVYTHALAMQGLTPRLIILVAVSPRVLPPSQLLSESMAYILERDQYKKYLSPLVELCRKMNRYVDIMNGRVGAIKKDSELLKELLEILDWFEEWHKQCQGDSYLSLSEKCWYDLKLSILGFVGICNYIFAEVLDDDEKADIDDIYIDPRYCIRFFDVHKGNSGGANLDRKISDQLFRHTTEREKRRREKYKLQQEALQGGKRCRGLIEQ